MTAIRTAALTIAMLILGTNAFGNDPSPGEILKELAATYKTMKTYKSEGTFTELSENKRNKGVVEFSFSILMKKPNLYLITWTKTNTPPDVVRYFAVWSDGTQPYLYDSRFNAYFKMESDKMAFHKAKILNVPFIVPPLFLSVFRDDEAPFSWLNDPKVEKVEKIGEEDCYVISGTSAYYRREAIWVSKTSHLIKKYYRFRDYLDYTKMHLDYYKINKSRLGISDKEIEETVENFKRSNSTQSYTEVYTETSSPELNKDDFNFTLPEGTVLRDYLFRDVWDNPKVLDKTDMK